METDADFAAYECLVRDEPHRDPDFASMADLWNATREDVEAWIARDADGELVGWCAASVPSPYQTDQSVHLLGVVVARAFRKRGYARALVTALLDRYGDVTYTAAVKPGNTASEACFASLGFQPGKIGERWRTWYRTPTNADTVFAG